MTLSEELAGFLQEGLGIHIGTRDAERRPNGARAAAIRVEEDREHFLVFVAGVAAARVLPDLKANGQAAVVVGRPVDERSCQVKGVFVDARPAAEHERALVDRQWFGFMRQLDLIGIPSAMASAWTRWPAVAIRLKATAVFEQTPGPQAGQPIQ